VLIRTWSLRTSNLTRRACGSRWNASSFRVDPRRIDIKICCNSDKTFSCRGHHGLREKTMMDGDLGAFDSRKIKCGR